MDIRNAIEQLEKNNDAHFTSDGQPRVDAVSALVGKEVTRKEITDAALDPVVEVVPAPAAKPTGEEVYAKLQAEQVEIRNQLAALTARQKTITYTLSRMEQFNPYRPLTPREQSEQKMRYIRQQGESRAQQHAEMEIARKALGLKASATGSTLDAAMSRKTGRGGKRPNFNPVKAS